MRRKIATALPDMISVRHLLDLYGLRAQSQLSQNFLLNQHVTGGFKKYYPSICTQFSRSAYATFWADRIVAGARAHWRPDTVAIEIGTRT